MKPSEHKKGRSEILATAMGMLKREGIRKRKGRREHKRECMWNVWGKRHCPWLRFIVANQMLQNKTHW